ncbi:unnamed protein product [Albugo candida]|nr:unnamed protein product [Albugo candida]|eukprot:CCI50310.1 unnamed protein product [Albugo candida]
MRGINRRVFSADSGATELLHVLLSRPTEFQTHSEEYQFLGNAVRSEKPATANTSADPIDYQGIQIKDWVIGSNKSHITPVDLLEKIGAEANLTPPEMVFGGNQLMFFHVPSGLCYNFLAVDALKCVHFAAQKSKNETQKQLKVAIAKQRSTNDQVKELDIPYDWTYTTEYRGTLSKLASSNGVFNRTDQQVQIEATKERIDMDKLKEREPILWFDDVNLYEDELHDHGISIMNVKVRVMPSGFYILARYWLRLDRVVLRVYETRIHHLFGNEYLLREYSRKESTVEELGEKGHSKNMTDYRVVDQFHHLLTLQEAVYEKILIESE